MTRERPILFSGPMVRAILEGRKTQTRRVVKPLQSWLQQGFSLDGAFADPGLGDGGYLKMFDKNGLMRRLRCPYGKPGDRLWVRETFDVLATGEHPDWDIKGVSYKADDGFVEAEGKLKGRNTYGLGWKPSIHMPRWASRILLEITAVRVECLQDISEADALAEGVCCFYAGACPEFTHGKEFEYLWSKINGPESWAANPWVWVVEFRVVEVKPCK